MNETMQQIVTKLNKVLVFLYGRWLTHTLLEDCITALRFCLLIVYLSSGVIFRHPSTLQHNK